MTSGSGLSFGIFEVFWPAAAEEIELENFAGDNPPCMQDTIIRASRTTVAGLRLSAHAEIVRRGDVRAFLGFTGLLRQKR